MERDTDKSKNGVERSEELQQLMQSEEEGSGGYGSTNSDAYESFSFLEMKLDDDKCTVLETTSNLTSVLTGSGLLSLPFAAYLAGWSAVLYLVVLAGIFMYSLCLIAESVETHYTRHRLSGKLNQTVTDIDYLTLGKVAFGERGEVIVSVVFGIEFFLALVSMLINIGLNINTINSKISPVSGIAIGTVLSLVLSLTNLKLAAYSSMIGLCMTLLTVIAVLLAGLELENPHAEYSVFSIEGTPLALGLIAFCFGGHATL